MSPIVAFDHTVVMQWNHVLTLSPFLHSLILLVGSYMVYAIPLVWIVWWFMAKSDQKELLLSSMLAGLLAWQGLNRIFKLFLFRPRPIQTLHLQEILFERPENSFPSDHAAFFSGIAFFFLLRKSKRPGWLMLVLGVLVGLCRITLGWHYPTDIVVGFVVGFLMAWVINWLHPWLTRTVWAWVLGLAKKLHLA